MSDNLDITNTTQAKPRIAFAEIKKHILGVSYELSLVLMGDHLGKRMSLEHKNKNIPTNVLSFPLSKTEGEIFINVRRAQRDAKKFGHTQKQHIAFLFIHGCLHLKGHSHGNTMEKKEEQLLKKFST